VYKRQEQTDGQLNLPKYGEDKFVAFIDKNMMTIYISFLIIFFLSGLWK
jgi:hypothetical protein